MSGAAKKVRKKICLLGDPSVGKTSLIRRFVLGKFDDKYLSTLGTKVSKKNLELSKDGIDYEISLLVWDVAGQEQFQRVHASAFKGSDGALIVGDLTRFETLQNMANWASKFMEAVPKASLLFLGNKSDLAKGGREQVEGIARAHGSSSLLTSAKTGMGVEDAFLTLGSLILMGEHARLPAGGGPSASSDISPILKVEDEIVERFCKAYGDYELAMDIVRKQFAEMDIDFRSLTKAELVQVSNKLLAIIRKYKGDSVAGREKQHFIRLLNQC